jgi:hypothetical protein
MQEVDLMSSTSWHCHPNSTDRTAELYFRPMSTTSCRDDLDVPQVEKIEKAEKRYRVYVARRNADA